MTGLAAVWLLATIPVFLAAASLSRLYVANSAPWALAGMLALYCIGNLMMVRLMRESGLAVAISVSSIAQLLLVNLVAFTVFGERLPPLQLAGMALGLSGLVLMMWPVAR
jgi:small multidrug resistance pump